MTNSLDRLFDPIKVLITGSSGYIGSNLVQYLSKNGFVVYPLDIKIDSKKDVVIEDLQKYVDDGVDYVIHLAGISTITECESDYENAVRNNFLSTLNILKYDFPVVFFANSQSTKDPLSSIYSATKYFSNAALKFLGKNKSIYSLKFSNVYGGINYLEEKTSVFACFARCIKSLDQTKSLKINGDGTQKRDFLHVDDLCYAIYELIRREEFKIYDSCVKQRIEEFYELDLGSGESISINDLAQMFIKKFKVDVHYDKEGFVGVKENYTDLTEIRKLIDYYPKNSLEKTINSL